MLRRTIHKIFSARKIPDKYANDQDLEDETDTAADVFRQTFINKFNLFKLEASIFAEGNADFSDSWKDTLGKEGTGLAAAITIGIIGLLGALSIMSAGLAAGLALLITVIGVLAVVAFSKYRDYVKQDRYESAAAIMDNDYFSDNVITIANILSELYELQLASCTVKDARVLAESCVKALSLEILKNDKFRFDELLNSSSLQAVLMRSLNAMPKVKLDMNLNMGKKLNTRGVISHTGYYCRETDLFYKTEKSKALKYGVLFFDRKADLEDYEYLMTSSLKKGEDWSLTVMRPHEVHLMLNSSIFKPYRNDRVFKDKMEDDLGLDDRMKIT
jgi:hypothetical protein